MNLSLARNGQHLGTFPEHEVRQGIQAGQFLPHDLAWREGMPEWVTISQLLGLAPPPVPQGSPFAPPLPAPLKNPGDDFGMRLLLPVGRSGWSIAAGYMGLFSLLLVFAPFSIIVSLIAIRDIQKSKRPGNKPKHGMGRAVFGLIMGLCGTAAMCYFIYSMTQMRSRY